MLVWNHRVSSSVAFWRRGSTRIPPLRYRAVSSAKSAGWTPVWARNVVRVREVKAAGRVKEKSVRQVLLDDEDRDDLGLVAGGEADRPIASGVRGFPVSNSDNDGFFPCFGKVTILDASIENCDQCATIGAEKHFIALLFTPSRPGAFLGFNSLMSLDLVCQTDGRSSLGGNAGPTEDFVFDAVYVFEIGGRVERTLGSILSARYQLSWSSNARSLSGF
ncbi:hypothetical protein EVAR_77029_1 [Eumeta japonica]|uniref:Uncharacterized protein n=1 Tax=Eumeta variegata TaxID=151549 RepID=A0A4C1T1D0_EUMVA|nr:hypothetical protein EVAR_77029_1 [Eumeta japonica]